MGRIDIKIKKKNYDPQLSHRCFLNMSSQKRGWLEDSHIKKNSVNLYTRYWPKNGPSKFSSAKSQHFLWCPPRVFWALVAVNLQDPQTTIETVALVPSWFLFPSFNSPTQGRINLLEHIGWHVRYLGSHDEIKFSLVLHEKWTRSVGFCIR